MKFKIGDRFRVEWVDEDLDIYGSFIGDIGTVVGYANREWNDGDVVVDLDNGISGLIYDSELLVKIK